MTEKDLNSLFYLQKEIRRIKARIQELGEDTVKAVSYDSEPRGGGVSNPTQAIALKRIELLEYLTKLYEQKYAEAMRIYDYIDKCDDAEVKSIMSMRFIDCRSWYYIQTELCKDRSTLQKKLNKYIRLHNSHI